VAAILSSSFVQPFAFSSLIVEARLETAKLVNLRVLRNKGLEVNAEGKTEAHSSNQLASIEDKLDKPS